MAARVGGEPHWHLPLLMLLPHGRIIFLENPVRDAVRGTLLVLAMSLGLSGGVWAATGSERAAGTTWIFSHYAFIPLADRILHPRDRWRGSEQIGPIE